MQIRSQDKTMYQADESSRKALSNNTKFFFLCMWEWICLCQKTGQYFHLVWAQGYLGRLFIYSAGKQK